jgi:hypothetical protein
LVERNLAKVEVESSRLFSRSKFVGKTVDRDSSRFPLLVTVAGWQSGHAAACKAVYAGSIPTPASSFTTLRRGPVLTEFKSRRASGEIGIHKGLKIPRRKPYRFESGLAHHNLQLLSDK